MGRLIPFGVILGIFTYLAWKACEQLGYVLDRMSFTVGIMVAALTGFIWFLLSDWWSIATRPYRPQAVTSRTAETPSQIGCAAFWAAVRLLFVVVAVIALLIWIIRSY